MLQNHSRISEKVQKSLEVLTQIKNLSIQTETDRKSYNEATRKTQKTQQQQETLEQKAEQWKIQSEELAEVDKKLAVAEGKKEEADAVSQEISDVRTLGNQAEFFERTGRFSCGRTGTGKTMSRMWLDRTSEST